MKHSIFNCWRINHWNDTSLNICIWLYTAALIRIMADVRWWAIWSLGETWLIVAFYCMMGIQKKTKLIVWAVAIVAICHWSYFMKVKYNTRIKGLKDTVDGFALSSVEIFILSNVILKCKIMRGKKLIIMYSCGSVIPLLGKK